MKTLVAILTGLIVLLSAPLFSSVQASDIAGSSARLDKNSKVVATSTEATVMHYAKIKKALNKVFSQYGSPFAGKEDMFITTCKTYELDCFLLPSIAGIESGFGRVLIKDTYNPFGWGRGTIQFNSWEDGVDTVGKGLRTNYLNKGLLSIEDIGHVYCEGSTWSGKVKYFMAKFQEAYNEIQIEPLITVQ